MGAYLSFRLSSPIVLQFFFVVHLLHKKKCVGCILLKVCGIKEL